MRHVTEEQKQKAAERRERFRGLVKLVAAMSDAERAELAMRSPVVNCEGKTLSGHNQLLLAMQFPAVTIVGGFRQWLAQGRCVRKGQSGLMLWVPITRKRDNGGAADGAEPGDDPTRFLVGTVFDVSQTDAMDNATAGAGAAEAAAA